MKCTTETPVSKTTSTVRGKQYDRYLVVYRDDLDRRKRKYFASLADANAFARQCDLDQANRQQRQAILERRVGVEDAGRLTASDLRDAIEALAILAGRGSLVDAARAFVADLDRRAKDVPTVKELVDQYVVESEGHGLRERSMGDIRHRLNRLVECFGAHRVDEVTGAEVKHRLATMKQRDGKPYSAVTRRHFEVQWQALFNFAIEREHIVENPVTSKTRLRRHAGRRAESTTPEIWSPAEVKALLLAARDTCPDMVAPLALGLFAGLRTAEMRRVTWERHVKVKQTLVAITGDVAKKRFVRNVDMSPNLVRWLALAPKQEGMVAPQSNGVWRARLEAIVKASGVGAWRPNAMRHSFGSYHLEMHQNPGLTALQMGHREAGDLLFEHYRQLTTKDVAAEYWRIEPPGEGDTGGGAGA